MQHAVQRLLKKLKRVRKVGKNQWIAECPAHDDRNPSLSVGRGRGGSAVVKCHAGCATAAVCKAVGLRLADLCAGRRREGGGGRDPTPQRATLQQTSAADGG